MTWLSCLECSVFVYGGVARDPEALGDGFVDAKRTDGIASDALNARLFGLLGNHAMR